MDNPFLNLFESSSDEKSVAGPSICDIIENIFKITLNVNKNDSKELLYLQDVSETQNSSELSIENLHHAIFERLFMCNSENLSTLLNATKNEKTTENRVIYYLYECYTMLENETKLNHTDKINIKGLILQNAATSVIQPDIFSGQDIAAQLYEILKENKEFSDTFFIETCHKVIVEDNNEETSLLQFISNLNHKFIQDVSKMTLVNIDYNIFNYINVFLKDEKVSELFITTCSPNRIHVGSDYVNTPLGVLFNISVLPKLPNKPYDYFTNPMDQASNNRTEGALWTSTDQLTQNIHTFLINLFKINANTKNKTLTWFGNFLKANYDKGKLWNNEGPPELNPAFYSTVSDGFMMNFTNVLLRMCQPFCANFKDKKILKVDPTYCAVPNDKTELKNVHMHNLSTETCFIPTNLNDNDVEIERPISNIPYNFITEIFFMTHKSIDLSIRLAVDQLKMLNREMAKMQRAFREALEQAGGNSEVVSTIKDRMNAELNKYLSLKCQLSDPVLLSNMFSFVTATNYWLCQLSIRNEFVDKNTFSPLEELQIVFPLSEKIPSTLKCVPEFVIENIVSFLNFIRIFTQKTLLEEGGLEKMSPILTCILIYMGCRDRMTNPHLRARLAEGLESLLPFHKDELPGGNVDGFQRELLFKQHPHRFEIVRSLMTVFVTIEMTGESVEFAQKFNYRRPMYIIFEYLWDIPEHVKCFRDLAEYAENNMEAVQPPLFLKFANLLINDAIYLLDEALANMKEIREMQHAQESGQWDNLNPRERSQNLALMHHTGNIARFDNILGRDTIKLLEKLTSKIQIVFTHSTMVDRIAAMLNYFLLNLVGPKQKNFKVKDAKEFSFDPAGMVLEICKIYLNLKNSDSFCLAVSQDSRSYSQNLFTQAEDVLVRIGGSVLIAELKEAASKIEEKAKEHQQNEEFISDAPDHFLDPIMSTLMTDPVILPSSRQTVDRSTIARHLLSDQTDPFNRAPLSMDQIIPNVELREEIRKWVEERRNKN